MQRDIVLEENLVLVEPKGRTLPAGTKVTVAGYDNGRGATPVTYYSGSMLQCDMAATSDLDRYRR